MRIDYEHGYGDACIIVPDCCEDIQKSLYVVLRYNWDDLSDRKACKSPPALADGAFLQDRLYNIFYNTEPYEDERTVFENAKPGWKSVSAVSGTCDSMIRRNIPNSGLDYLVHLNVKFCPHCGTKLPDVERLKEEELPGKIHVPVDDGNYCGTCEDRSGRCTCWPPEAAWRIKDDPRTN